MNKFKVICESIFESVTDFILLILGVVVAIVAQPALIIYVIIKSIITKTSIGDVYNHHTNIVIEWMSGSEEDE